MGDLVLSTTVDVVDGRARLDLAPHGLTGAVFRKTLGDRGGRIGDVGASVDGDVLVLDVGTSPMGEAVVDLEGRWVHGEVALRSLEVRAVGPTGPIDDDGRELDEMIRALNERKRAIAERVTGQAYTDG